MPPGRSPKEIAARGNKSKIDIDWMIGLDQIDNNGVDIDGGGTAIFPQRREWA
jgi:leucyl aminopeptidase (aminopeptidase T)